MPKSTAAKPAALLETMMFAGGAAVSFVLGLARTKLQALFWGPLGVGTIGLMQSAVSTATLVGGAGVDGYVTRELAANGEGAEQRRRLLSIALRGVPALALFASVMSFGLALILGERVGVGSAVEASIIACSVSLGVVAASYRAVLVGSRITQRLAIAQIAAAFGATLLTAALVAVTSGPVVWALAVAAIPLSQLVVFSSARAFGKELAPWAQSLRWTIEASRQAGILVLAGILPVITQLLIRMQVQAHLDGASLGAFQATLSLVATSVSVLASSIGPSVMPRLSAASGEPAQFRGLISDTMSEYHLLYAPIALVLVTVPELVTQILFAKGFEGVALQLRWQLVGELFRLPCWVLATALTAQGRYRAYFVAEAVALLATVGAVAVSARTGDLAVMGAALSCSTLLQFAALVLLVQPGSPRWIAPVAARHLLTAACVAALAWSVPRWPLARAAGIALALGFGVMALRRLRAVLVQRRAG